MSKANDMSRLMAAASESNRAWLQAVAVASDADIAELVEENNAADSGSETLTFRLSISANNMDDRIGLEDFSRFAKRIKCHQSEIFLWGMFLVATPHRIPDLIAADLLHRNIAVDSVIRRVDNVELWKIVSRKNDVASYLIAQRLCADNKSEELRRFLAEHGHQNRLFESLAHRPPFSPAIEAVLYEAFVNRQDGDRLLKIHGTNKLQEKNGPESGET
jgi:hypothetical protein